MVFNRAGIPNGDNSTPWTKGFYDAYISYAESYGVSEDEDTYFDENNSDEVVDEDAQFDENNSNEVVDADLMKEDVFRMCMKEMDDYLNETKGCDEMQWIDSQQKGSHTSKT